jgi:hypothetical protein
MIPKTMTKMWKENSVSRQSVVTGLSEAKSTMRPNGKGVQIKKTQKNQSQAYCCKSFSPPITSLTDCSPSYAPEIVQQYHTSIGGLAEDPLKKTKSKQSSRFGSEAKEPPAPAAKRQKRNILAPVSSITQEESAWVPTKEDWEPQVVKVEAVERDDSGKLLAYILFKNGKQINVSMDKVYRHCPRPMLRFYEEHLRFGPTNMEC